MLGGGDRGVPDVGLHVVDAGVLLERDRHVGVAQGVRVDPVRDAVQLGPAACAAIRRSSV